MSYYFSLMIFGFVLTMIGFSFLFVFLEESDWRGKKNIFEFVLDMTDIFLGTWWSMSVILFAVGLAGVGLIIYSFMGMTGIL